MVPAAVFYPDQSRSWVADDSIVIHFLNAFLRPRIQVFLYVGTAVICPVGTTFCTMCHRSNAQALATRKKSGYVNQTAAVVT